MKRTAYTAGSLYRTASARISLRWTAASGPDVTIIPSLGDRTNAATLCSMSAASRTLSGTSSMRSVGAIAWSTANWATAAVRPGSRSTATRVTCGAISLSSSSHLPLRPYSNWLKPVALPPGRARLSTKPAPTGSGTMVNTTGMARVICNKGASDALPSATITSGASATNSAVFLRIRSASPALQRASSRRLRPSVQPTCCSCCTNATMRRCDSGSSAVRFMSTPMRRIRSGCWARALSGHGAAAPPSVAKNFRRPMWLAMWPSVWGSFMQWTQDTTLPSRGLSLRPIGKSYEWSRKTAWDQQRRFGLCEECPVYSRKRRKSRHSLTSPQCQLRPSCTAAKRLFDHFVGKRQQLVWKLETECLGGREIDDQPVSRRLLHRKLGRLGALEDLVDVDSGAPSQIVDVRAVTHETAGLHIPLAPEHPRQPVLQRKLGQACGLRVGERRRHGNKAADGFSCHRHERPLELLDGCRRRHVELDRKLSTGGLEFPQHRWL